MSGNAFAVRARNGTAEVRGLNLALPSGSDALRLTLNGDCGASRDAVFLSYASQHFGAARRLSLRERQQEK